MKNIYLIVGASGTGKSTLVQKLVEYYNAVEVLSYTDRAPRYDGEGTHIFLSKEEFDKLPDLCAFTNFSGHRYGVTEEVVDKSDFYVIDPAGVMYFYKHYHGKKSPIVIGITSNETIIKNRLMERDDSIARIEHDKDIFTDSVMNLICNDIIDNSGDINDSLNKIIRTIDNYEENENVC